jgi:hypothetical protein
MGPAVTPTVAPSVALRAIWERHREVVLGRLEAIEHGAEHEPGSEARAEGARAAHQLAGTVGTFGFTSATEILDGLRSLLAGRGFEIVTEVDPRRVLVRLPEVAPGLLILDIDMPEMDGIELCRRIRADPDHRGLRTTAGCESSS